jgi:hypothetical protein
MSDAHVDQMEDAYDRGYRAAEGEAARLTLRLIDTQATLERANAEVVALRAEVRGMQDGGACDDCMTEMAVIEARAESAEADRDAYRARIDKVRALRDDAETDGWGNLRISEERLYAALDGDQ